MLGLPSHFQFFNEIKNIEIYNFQFSILTLADPLVIQPEKG